MATVTHDVLLTAEQFLEIDFGPDKKAELDNGVIRMMAGGNRAHARIQRNLLVAFGNALAGSGCVPFGSDMGVRTHDRSVRYPDLTVVCDSQEELDDDKALTVDPCVVIEILSPSTAKIDQTDKLQEYRALPRIDTIVFVDPVEERLRIVQLNAPQNWSDVSHMAPIDLPIPSLGVTIPHDAIFARP